MPSRRRFLQSGAVVGMGLLIGVRLERAAAQGDPAAPGVFAPNAFVRIAPDNTVTIIAKHVELGQGAHTGLATLLAEELDADWSQIRIESAPADVSRYNNLAWGPAQGTGGSSAIANSWEQLRRAGATARAMLVAAAAQRWQVRAAEITVDAGVVAHPATGRRATFGELAAEAARQTPPAQVALKDPKDFKLIGRRAPRVDSLAKTNGQERQPQSRRRRQARRERSACRLGLDAGTGAPARPRHACDLLRAGPGLGRHRRGMPALAAQCASRRYHTSLSWKPGYAAFRPLGLGTTNTAAPPMRSGLAPGPALAEGPTNSRYAVRPTNATTAG
jgi:hypothetical protein